MKAKFYERLIREIGIVVDEGIHVVDADGKTIIYTQNMATLEKTKCEDVIGKPFRDVFSDIPEGESTLLRALRRGEPTLNKQQTYHNQYGKEITTLNSTVPITENDGTIVAALEIAKDITNIKELSNTVLDLQGGRIPENKTNPLRIKHYSFDDIIGQSDILQEQLQIAKRATKTDASVFVYGETGTGKELMAQSIHFGSDRASRPFLAQNCAALPESLLEGILFGTAKGGFTGAVDRAGLFEQASGGTLLLDEISAMPYELQSKLLRVLQECYIRRVGGSKDIPIDVRIIATVNEDPIDLIKAGRLRKDLYYRLNIINVTIPPLRDRKSDIPILVNHFIEKHSEKGIEKVVIDASAMKKLMEYSYPGNIRELENIIFSSISLVGDDEIITDKLIRLPMEISDLTFKNDYDSTQMSMSDYIDAIEQKIIKDKLIEFSGNISKAAEDLQMKRQTLQHKIKKFGIKTPKKLH
ncbi:MAG: sigma-54 interaction domain-containing protein [Eubacteriales bacterium]